MDKIQVSEDLLKIKDLIQKPIRRSRGEQELTAQLKRLGHKVEKIEKIVGERRGRFCPEKTKQILFLLENKPMTATEIGKLLKLSRNRANEYLRKLERELLLKSELRGKKKYYRILKND